MPFPTNCDPRIIAVDASCGCALTRANIRGMTPQDFEDQGAKEVGMDKIIANAKEAKASGAIEGTLEMMLMGRMAPLTGAITQQPIGDSQSVILPYIYRQQKRNINANYFKLVSGAATAGAGSGTLHPGAWNLVIRNTGSTYGSVLPSIHNYFLPQKYLMVEYLSAAGAAVSAQFRVIASVDSSSGGTTQATVTVEPNVTTTAWNASTAAEKLKWQVNGDALVYNMANSVSDYESYCHQTQALNARKLLAFWMQTTRETHCFNDEYLKALNASLLSGYWNKFKNLSVAEQKAQQHAQSMKDWWNSVIFGQRINETQNVETYQSLETVVDPLNPNCVLEYKANALGAKTQLSDCGRVSDKLGAALNLDDVFSNGYDLKRSREANGGSIERIEFGTDRFTAGAILAKMQGLYKAKYGVETTRFYQPNQALSHEGQTLLKYNVYELPSDLGGYELAIWTHQFFDDRLAATPTSQRNRSRMLLGLDISDLTVGIIGTASATRVTNEHDNLYNCVIKPNLNHYTLHSTKWTTILEDVNRHSIIENFSDECPELTVSGC